MIAFGGKKQKPTPTWVLWWEMSCLFNHVLTPTLSMFICQTKALHATSSKMDHPNFKVQRRIIHSAAVPQSGFAYTQHPQPTCITGSTSHHFKAPLGVMSSKPLKTYKRTGEKIHRIGPVPTQDASTVGSEMILWSFLSRDWLNWTQTNFQWGNFFYNPEKKQLGVFQMCYRGSPPISL